MLLQKSAFERVLDVTQDVRGFITETVFGFRCRRCQSVDRRSQRLALGQNLGQFGRENAIFQPGFFHRQIDALRLLVAGMRWATRVDPVQQVV